MRAGAAAAGLSRAPVSRRLITRARRRQCTGILPGVRPYFSDSPPLAIAHRGSRLLWPENTLVAFQGAKDLGYRYMETDLHMTSDGVLVAFHDDTLERITDGSGSVSSVTW